MKKLLYSLIIIIAAICACRDENSELGKSSVDSSFYNIYVDTCTVDISTILMDSIETGGDSICQLGHYKGSVMGRSLCHLLCRILHKQFHSQRELQLQLRLTRYCGMTPSGHFWGDTLTATHLSIPAETAYLSG